MKLTTNWNKLVCHTDEAQERATRTFLFTPKPDKHLFTLDGNISMYFRKGIENIETIIPRLLICSVRPHEKLSLVKWGKGVHTILKFGKYPTPISDEVILIMKSRIGENNIFRPVCNLNKNDHIIITSGPLKDLVGIFERRVSDSGRVRILLNLVGYQPSVVLESFQVKKICA